MTIAGALMVRVVFVVGSFVVWVIGAGLKRVVRACIHGELEANPRARNHPSWCLRIAAVRLVRRGLNPVKSIVSAWGRTT